MGGLGKSPRPDSKIHDQVKNANKHDIKAGVLAVQVPKRKGCK